MNNKFSQIINTIDYDHYFDSEKWFCDVLKSSYDIIEKDGFAILLEYRRLFGYKVGHSRGGIRFDRNKKTFEEYLEFIKFLKSEAKAKGYMLVGMEPVEPANKFNTVFKTTKFREAMPATAFIYPKENWLNRFNSKKRYDLTYAAKKGVKVEIITNPEKLSEELVTEMYNLMLFTLTRHVSKYTIPDRETFGRIFKYMDFMVPIAWLDGKLVSFTICLHNANKTRVERLYAASNETGLKLRAPSLIEVEMVDYLYHKGIKIYDLWGIRLFDDGVTVFKKNIADDVVCYAPYSVITILKPLANVTIILVQLSMYMRFLLNRRRNKHSR